jgi:hypothetical protein
MCRQPHQDIDRASDRFPFSCHFDSFTKTTLPVNPYETGGSLENPLIVRMASRTSIADRDSLQGDSHG